MALFVQGHDALEQFAVEQGPVVVSGELRRHLSSHDFQRVIGVGGDEIEERGADTPQHLARALHGDQGVPEGRRLTPFCDGVDLGALLGHAALEGGREMAVFDPVEVRHLEEQRALREERIAVAGTSVPIGLCPRTGGCDQNPAHERSQHGTECHGALPRRKRDARPFNGAATLVGP